MSYRNITVLGRDYQFTIGRVFTKVRGDNYSKLFRNDEWGMPIAFQSIRKDEAGNRKQFPYLKKGKPCFVITPKTVSDMIMGKRPHHNLPRPCRHHPDEMITGLTFSPFDGEIRDKRTLMNNCHECVEDDSYAI